MSAHCARQNETRGQSVALERAKKTSSDMFYGKEVPEGLNSDHSSFSSKKMLLLLLRLLEVKLKWVI